jgi:SAM-dependent methyltransferase
MLNSPRAVHPVDPVWPLPRDETALSEDELRAQFPTYQPWHYSYDFVGGLSFPRGDDFDEQYERTRPLQRFRHFMPYLLGAHHGSLRGKRVLDMACNSGFWSVQCALLGADVVGFDARPELVAQANFIKHIVGLQNVEFRILDFWEANPRSLGGTFDIVLNLGLLYHLPSPYDALRLTKSLATQSIVLDTEVYQSPDSVIKVRWEEPRVIRNAYRSGIIEVASKPALDLMLRDLKFREWIEIPLRSSDMPRTYLIGRRASWLISV